MNLVKVFMSRWSRPKTVAKDASEQSQAFALALAIVSEYGTALEKPKTDAGLGPLRSNKDLKHNTETIRQAITFLQLAIASPTGRADLITALSPDEAQYVLSDTFAKGLDSGLEFLNFYVSDSELGEQRKLKQDISMFMDDHGPDAPA